MWKIAVFAFLCLCAGVASAGRLPRNDEVVSEEECEGASDCADCKYILVDGTCYIMATESQNKCTVQEQCAEIIDSVCTNGVCIRQKGLGEPCQSNEECTLTNQSVCNSGTCECPLGNVQFGDTCLIQAGALGDACEEDVQCEGVTGVCSNGTCQAKGPSVILCNDENAEMGNDGCQCLDGFVEAEDRKSCLKVAEKLGDECSTTQQCEPVNGTCTGGVCTEVILSAAAVPVEGTPKLLERECTTDEHCSNMDNAICKDSTCQCKETHVLSEDASKCLPIAKKSGDSCEIDKQCSKIPNSSCVGGKCASVQAAGIKTRKNGTSSPFLTSARILITTIIMLGSRAIFT